MGQPVKLSDSLVSDARQTAEVTERSIAGQIEFWARLGRSMELLLGGAEALALRKSGEAISLSELLSTVDAPAGRQRLTEYLAQQPYPHYEAAPGHPGMVTRVDADGTRTVGKFVNGNFREAKAKVAKHRTTRKRSPAQAQER